MNWKIVGYIAGAIVFFVLVGGLGWVIVRPTNSVRVGAGGKAITINTEPPTIPIIGGGCSISRMNLKTQVNWIKGFNLQDGKTTGNK